MSNETAENPSEDPVIVKAETQNETGAQNETEAQTQTEGQKATEVLSTDEMATEVKPEPPSEAAKPAEETEKSEIQPSKVEKDDDESSKGEKSGNKQSGDLDEDVTMTFPQRVSSDQSRSLRVRKKR